jgi:hypothetical protein
MAAFDPKRSFGDFDQLWISTDSLIEELSEATTPRIQTTAMQSISMSNGPGKHGTHRKMRAGDSLGKYLA